MNYNKLTIYRCEDLQGRNLKKLMSFRLGITQETKIGIYSEYTTRIQHNPPRRERCKKFICEGCTKCHQACQCENCTTNDFFDFYEFHESFGGHGFCLKIVKEVCKLEINDQMFHKTSSL